MSVNKQKGEKGEDLAVLYLQETLGFDIIDRNVRTSRAEIDIIAINASELRFIEVKSRMDSAQQTILSSLEERKLKQLTKGAADYVSVNNIVGVTDIYFDLVTVIFHENGEYDIEYIPSFFYPTW